MPSIVEIEGQLKLNTSDFDQKLDQAEAKAKGMGDVQFGSTGASQYGDVAADVDGLTTATNRAADAQERLSLQMRGEALVGAGETINQWTAGLEAFASGSVDAASDLNESMSAVGTVFGDAAGEVTTFADSAAQNLGMTENQALQTSAQLGAMFTAMGLTQDATAGMSNELLTAAADLGSFHNAMPIEAMGALRAGLIGESEPLRRFGILLSADAVEAKGLEMGLGDVNGEMSEGEKVQARYALIMEQLGAAQGDFARTSTGLANATRIQQAAMADLRAEIGVSLLPIQLEMMNVQNRLIGVISNLPPEIQKYGAIAAFAAGQMGPLITGMGRLMMIAPQLGSAMALLTGPIGLVVLALAALGVAYATNFLGFRDAVDGVVSMVLPMLQGLAAGVMTFVDNVKLIAEGGSEMAGFMGNLPGPINAVAMAIGELLHGAGEMAAGFQNAIAAGLDPLNAAFLVLSRTFPALTGAFAVGRDVIQNTLDTIGEIAGSLQEALTAIQNGDWGAAFSAIGDAVFAAVTGFYENLNLIGQGIIDAFNAVDWEGVKTALLAGLQQASTGLQTWLQEQSDALMAWFNAVDWTGVATAAAGMIGSFLSGAQEKWTEVTNWLGTLATNAVIALGPLLEALLTKGGELVGGFLQGAQDKWPEVEAWLGGIKDTALTAAGDLATSLLDQGSALIGGLLTGITDKWPEVDSWLAALPQDVLDTIGDLSSTLLAHGTALLAGFKQGVDDAWPAIDAWFMGLPQDILDTIGDLIATLTPRGSDLMAGFKQGVDNTWVEIDAWFAALPQDVVDTIGDLLGTLVDRGTDLMTGFYTAVGDYWTGTIAPWLTSIPELITSTIGDLLGTLTQKGTDLITGFKDGIDVQWEVLIAWFATLPTLLGNAIGDLSGILFEKGASLLGGFIEGIRSKIPELDGVLGAVGGAVGGAVTNIGNTLGAAGEWAGGQLGIGYENGIAGQAGTVADATSKALVEPVTGTIVTSFGIRSPSTVMYGYGQNIVAGFVGGAESLVGDLRMAFEELAKLVVGIFDQMEQAVIDHMQGLVLGVEEAANDASSATASLTKTMTSVGGVEEADRERKERSYEREMRRQDRADRVSEDLDGNPRRRDRDGGRGDTYNVTLPHANSKEFERWARQQQRKSRTAEGRGQ